MSPKSFTDISSNIPEHGKSWALKPTVPAHHQSRASQSIQDFFKRCLANVSYPRLLHGPLLYYDELM
jgi:hypothetical protein